MGDFSLEIFESGCCNFARNLRRNLVRLPEKNVLQLQSWWIQNFLVNTKKEIMNLGELLFELLSEALGLKPNHLKDMGCTESLVMFGQEIYIGGLQVLHGQYWVDVPPVPGAFVVNIGDLLQLISNDKFISVEHRVVANGAAQPRISVPCFFSSIMKANPRVYGPIKELLSEQNPPKYRELTISEFSNMFGTKELNTSALHHFKI
ncbi:hypothetical protein HID58_082703 [Brassica napus]|uniref:Fe2OG dioxygenase domain-containing protein n=1 Tax=Brassica napus TaxID=3708 RepID=A0ABQ7YBB8_BRANA|nr:hypothetical protein HID58_082703 [Brassica napus]